MASRPGLFFYRDSWDSEPSLAVCSEGAQYLWFKMLLLMNESDPRGYLLLNGKSPTPKQVAALTRTDPEHVEARLGELEEAGAFSRDRHGVIYSRRMLREEKKARIARENGKKGGNPSLRKQTEITPSDNQGGNGRVIPLNSKLQTQANKQDSESPTTDAESSTPREPEDGASAPVVVAVEDPASMREFVDLALLVCGANPALTARKVRCWVGLHGLPRTESVLVDALMRARRNPVVFAEEILNRIDDRRFAAVESAKHLQGHGRPDPNMEADRMLREVLATMEQPTNDHAAGDSRLPDQDRDNPQSARDDGGRARPPECALH